jgi:hypothetical protein
MVANLYYAQALIGLIAPAIGLAPRLAGLTATLTQLGYGAGLLLIVSSACCPSEGRKQECTADGWRRC